MKQPVYLDYDSNDGLKINIIMDTENSIETRYKRQCDKQFRLFWLNQFKPHEYHHILIQRNYNNYVVRVQNTYHSNLIMTEWYKKFHKREIKIILDLFNGSLPPNLLKIIIGKCHNFQNINGDFIASMQINHWTEIKTLITNRNTELCQEIIKESLSPKRIQRMFDAGMQDIDELF